jgi:GMP synthase (glutamine-hydrolysing)
MIIPVVNLGGQYNHLITRALTELDVKSELVPMSITKKDLEEMKADGLVMGGGPQRIGFESEKLGNLSNMIKEAKIPMLGLCVTHQLIASVFGGKAGQAKYPEYGPVKVYVDDEDEILKNFNKSFLAWETHNDEVTLLPENFEILAHSEKCKIQVMRHKNKPIFGVQFHPEVIQTEKGSLIFKNFIDICKK